MAGSVGMTREEVLAQGCTEKRNQRGTVYFENVVGEVVAKVCTKCEEVTLIEMFYNQKECLGGRQPTCKTCTINKQRKYSKDNPEKVREAVRKYTELNPEKVRDSHRAWRVRNSEKIREDNRVYSEINRERNRERIQKYRELNPEKVRESLRKSGHKYAKSNPEKIRDNSRKYYEANPKKVRENVYKWRKSNPCKYALTKQRRRARKAGLSDTLTTEQWANVVDRFGGGCALTGSASYVKEHAIPLACGHGGTTLENMTPMRADLNNSKHAQHIFEWFSDNRERFNLSQAKFDALIAYLAEVNGMTTKEYRAYVDWCFDNPRSLDELTEEEIA